MSGKHVAPRGEVVGNVTPFTGPSRGFIVQVRESVLVKWHKVGRTTSMAFAEQMAKSLREAGVPKVRVRGVRGDGRTYKVHV